MVLDFKRRTQVYADFVRSYQPYKLGVFNSFSFAYILSHLGQFKFG